MITILLYHYTPYGKVKSLEICLPTDVKANVPIIINGFYLFVYHFFVWYMNWSDNLILYLVATLDKGFSIWTFSGFYAVYSNREKDMTGDARISLA